MSSTEFTYEINIFKSGVSDLLNFFISPSYSNLCSRLSKLFTDVSNSSTFKIAKKNSNVSKYEIFNTLMLDNYEDFYKDASAIFVDYERYLQLIYLAIQYKAEGYLKKLGISKFNLSSYYDIGPEGKTSSSGKKIICDFIKDNRLLSPTQQQLISKLNYYRNLIMHGTLNNGLKRKYYICNFCSTFYSGILCNKRINTKLVNLIKDSVPKSFLNSESQELHNFY